MKIECLLKTNKNNTGYYLYVPLIEKYIFLEKVEQKLIQLMLDTKDLDKTEEKSVNK